MTEKKAVLSIMTGSRIEWGLESKTADLTINGCTMTLLDEFQAMEAIRLLQKYVDYMNGELKE